MSELPRSTPSKEGIDPELLVDFLNACEKSDSEIHGIAVARHGKVILDRKSVV